MEIYKLAVEMADRVSARRAIANAFFLTVNTALIAVVGLRDETLSSAMPSFAVCIAGIAVAGCWWYLLQNYRRLNEAKFVVINKIEADNLPIQAFADEWTALSGATPSSGRSGKIKAGLKQLGGVERIVPIVFGLLYFVLLLDGMV